MVLMRKQRGQTRKKEHDHAHHRMQTRLTVFRLTIEESSNYRLYGKLRSPRADE